uniref:Uncharacterized protein n=1 Tax=Cannabis sativa TaxID=3483 RepID=A0A803NJ45_CANSA
MKSIGSKGLEFDGLRLEIETQIFFHKHASSRRKFNRIKYLKNEEGVVVNTQDGIAELVISYFSDLFSSQGSDIEAAASIFESLGLELDDPEINFLAQDFTADEVKKAVFQLLGDKVVGLDGLNAFFYQKKLVCFRD